MAGSRRTPLGVALAALVACAAVGVPAPAAHGAALAPGQRLHVTVTLRPRHPGALAAYARAVSTPGSDVYRQFLTPRQFARRFAPLPDQISLVRRALRARGLDPGPTAAGGLSIPVKATVGGLEHGLSIALTARAGPARRTAIAASGVPSLGQRAGRVVQSVLGLNTVSSPHPLLVHSRPRAIGSSLPSPHVATGGPQACPQAQSVAANQNANTADQIASAYGFSGLYGAGDQGAGVTVAIYELEPDNPDDIAAYQACYGTHVPVSYTPVDGGAGSGPGSGESALDIENLIGLVPGANVIVYQGPNANSAGPGSGPYDTFAAIVNQDRARVVSVSWGECETALGEGAAAAEGALFQQAAAQGQTIVAAAGDSGSEDCADGNALSQNQLAVDDPSSQPFVTGVGGTTLQARGPRPTESVWNSGGTIVGGLLQPGAGGGGISNLWPMPRYQLDAASALRVLGAGRTGAACDDAGGYCREVPDVSGNADPATGYVVYWTGGDPGEPSGWQSIGGTSAAAPVWSALLTLADASRACAGNPIGFANPALYRAAGGGYAGDFNDVLSGNNDFTSANGGRFAAGPGYDEASGLGSPNGGPLAAALCADTLKLVNPGRPRLTVHAAVSLRLRALDPRGVSINYAARGLPSGLLLNVTTGRITGHPRRTGTALIRVTAQDSEGSVSSTAFAVTVGRAPKISRASVAGLRGRRPRVSFTVTAGRGAPPFQRLTVSLPSGLRLASTRGVAIRTRGVRHPRFRARLAGGRLQITLRRSLSELSVALSHRAVKAVSGRRARSRGRAAKLGLSIVDTGSGTSQLQSRLAAVR